MATLASGGTSSDFPAHPPSASPDARENPHGQTLAATLRQCARVAFLLFASDLAAEWGDDLCREMIAEAGF